MQFNVSSDFIVYLCASIPSMLAGFISLKDYQKYSFSHSLLMAITWFSTAAWAIIQSLAYLFLSSVLALLLMLVFIPAGYATIFSIDALVRNHIEWKKITIISSLTAFLIFSMFESNIVYFQRDQWDHGRYSLIIQGAYYYAVGLYTLTVALFMIGFYLRIYLSSPSLIKKKCRILLYGVLFIFLVPVVVLLRIDTILFGGIDAIFVSLGTLSIAIAFHRDVRLSFVIPSKISNITVIHGKSGMNLYSHTWGSFFSSEKMSIYSGALTALNTAFTYSMNKGQMNELNFDQGTITMLHLSKPNLFFALFSESSSLALRQALDYFAQEFVRINGISFEKEILNINQDANIEILKQIFPYQPMDKRMIPIIENVK